jgi:hypothetical protein
MEVHSLLCEPHMEFAIFCLQSLFEQSFAPIRLVVHDDGSLSARSLDLLSEAFPDSLVISREQAAEELAGELARYPAIAAARQELPHVIKLFDVTLMGNDRSISRYVDSDVLFLRRFSDLFPTSTPQNISGVFSTDSSNSFGVKVTDFWPIGPLILAERLNSGVFWIQRRYVDLDRVDWLFKRWGPARVRQYGGWFEQTVWADLAWRARALMFDSAQLRAATAKTESFTSEIAVHFVTPARALLLKLKNDGQSSGRRCEPVARFSARRPSRFGLIKATNASVRFHLRKHFQG